MKIKKAVFPVAGLGTRFLPATKAMPKEMLTIVDRPVIQETTALGAAWLAGQQAGLCPDMESFGANWALERRFEPAMSDETRQRRYAGWQDAVRRTLGAPV